ncbi:hypothetical protein ACWD7F_34595 [Streptomyces sp. NPDC005122]
MPAPPLPPSLTDRGNARLFVQRYRDRFRHVEGLGWFAWDGYRWKRTGGEKAALWAAGEMAEDLPTTDPHGLYSNRDLARHKRRILSRSCVRDVTGRPRLSSGPGPAGTDGHGRQGKPGRRADRQQTGG